MPACTSSHGFFLGVNFTTSRLRHWVNFLSSPKGAREAEGAFGPVRQHREYDPDPTTLKLHSVEALSSDS
ncbi:hypothetical protein MRX96_023714 [Rhipicephalus microplus]